MSSIKSDFIIKHKNIENRKSEEDRCISFNGCLIIWLYQVQWKIWGLGDKIDELEYTVMITTANEKTMNKTWNTIKTPGLL